MKNSILYEIDKGMNLQSVKQRQRTCRGVCFPQKIAVTILMLLCSQFIFAQVKTVIGKVTDSESEPLIGVAVFTKDKSQASAITDLDGKYTIKVPSDGVIYFSYLGMKTTAQQVKGRSVINVVMQPDDATVLDEVVVSVGYGQVKKRDLTGAVGQANMDELMQAPTTSIDQALAGRIAGLSIITADGEPGSESTITIRGGGLSQDAAPLYIIDGFPMENFNLNTLDPRSIASIEVLKDASSIAIYGSRGANGVIIINTKEGEAGKPKVTYNYNLSLNTRPKFVEMMDAYDYVKLQLELDAMDNRDFSINRYLGNVDDVTGERPRTLDWYKEHPGTDWQNAVTQVGLTHNHSLSVSGGAKNTKYMVRGGYLNQEALVKNTGQKRFNVQGKLDQKFNKYISANLSADFSETTTNTNQAFTRARSFFPTTGLQNIEDFIKEMEHMLAEGTMNDAGVDYGSLITPLQQAENELNERVQKRTQLGLQLRITPINGLTITPKVQVSNIDTEARRYYNSKTYQGHLFKRSSGINANTNGINAYRDRNNVKNYLGELIVDYKKKFNKIHNLNAMYGFTYQYGELTKESYEVINISPEFEQLGFYGISAGAVKGGKTSYSSSRNQLVSSFGRINYTLMDKYLFTATARYDGSSKFAKGHQWGLFPSGAFAWRLSSEPFMKKIKAINDAKVRLSYGVVGNNRGVNDYSYLIQFGSLQNARKYMMDGSNLSTGIFQYFLANPAITWEKTSEFDIGFDLTMFNQRLSLSIDYYNKIVEDLLMPRPAPYYLGYANNTRYENAGSTQSRGVELTIVSTNIKAKNFSWYTNLNFSYNQNKVRYFAEGYDVMSMGGSGDFMPQQEAWVAIAGNSTSQFYGYKYLRLYQESDFYKNPNGTYTLKPGVTTYKSVQGGYRVQPGDPMYEDLNGDGMITDADRTTLGSPIPKIIGGISNSFVYKNWSLNVFFQYSLGGKIVDYNRYMFESTGSFNRYSNQYASYVNHWTPDNPHTDIPRLMRPVTKGDVDNTSLPKLSSRAIERSDYLRLATLSLTYRLPKMFVSKLRMKDITLNASAQNLFVWTPYKGQDPEVNSYNKYSAPRGIGYNQLTNSNTYTSMTGGLDRTPYPRARIFNFGISVTF